jgi:hypothetical protein
MTAVDIGHSTVMHGVVAQREHKRRGDGPVAEHDIAFVLQPLLAA